MASMTAVELGADMCALARTSVRRGEVQLLAAETLEPASFPGIDAFTGAVRQARKTLKLPKRCRAVIWGLPDGAKRKDPAVKPLIAPLVGAGFRVERVISPCNALAALARLKAPRGDGATCWLAINRTGVAMVVVRPGKQLFSHSFAWDSNVGSSGSQARLLQRYSLVAFLAPEIRRAMNAAREKGTPVDAIVTCGNLPEIRSLTMPLIEELDVEVESLDSLDGLIVKPEATEQLSEIAASLRIACAGAIARPTRQWDESKRPSSALHVLRFAAAAAVILVVGFLGWSWWNRQPAAPAPVRPATVAKVTPKPAPPKQTPAIQPPPPAPVQNAVTPPAVSPAVAPKADASAKAPASTKPSTPEPPPPQKTVTPRPVQPTPQTPPPSTTRQAAPQAVQQSAAKPPGGIGGVSRWTPSPAEREEMRKQAERRPGLDTPPRPADKPDAAPARAEGQGAAGRDIGQRNIGQRENAQSQLLDPARTARPPASMPEPLKDPVPRVTALLVSSDRRMATIDDGRIISVGEVLGKRVVVAIDERAVVLREPSGVQIRVGLGGRILGVERSER